MSIQNQFNFFLWLILFVSATEVVAQAPQDPQIVSSGFGENLSTGCPRLQVIDNMLYAPGPEGIKRRSKGNTASWEPFAMQGMNVIDFRISAENIIAVIIPEEYSQTTGVEMRSVARLVKGTVTGSSFVDITPPEMEYIYHEEILTFLSAIAQHPRDKERVMAMGHGGIFQSKDFGETWERISEYRATYNPHSFFGWHPQNPDIMFLTSESATFVGIVYRSTDGGKTWQWFEPDHYRESSCHYIAFDPDDDNHLLLSGEYAIYESLDCGETWLAVLDDTQNNNPILGYAYNIIYDPADNANSTIYSVGHTNGGSARNIVRSSDKGKTWQQCMTYDFDEEFNFIYDSALFDGKIWIYDYKDIVYWDIDGTSGMESATFDNTQPAKYYNLNGIRLNSRPASGIVIEKRGESSKKIVL